MTEPHETDAPIAPRPTLTLDFDRYAPFLDDEDIGEDDKRALLEALWSIVVGFVDLGFEVRAVGEASRAPVAQTSARALETEARHG